MYERDRAVPRDRLWPLTQDQAACPNGCGLCNQHASPPIMINIDLTNRCNLRCPVCFANASVRGEVVEPTIEQVDRMLDAVCAATQVLPACVQFSGGEPTIHPEFLEALRRARRRGFAQLQIATNGIRFVEDPDLAHQASEAGLNVAYLQFDGFDDQVYYKTRGRALVDVKLKAIDNLYEAGIRTVLVPTLVKGLNDQEIGKILRFAIDSIDKIAGVSWQPVSFTGRIDHEQRMAQRFTLADLAREVERQTGLVKMYRDWYPFGFVDPFSRLVEAVTGEPQAVLSCSPGCGLATSLLISRNGRHVLPIPAFVDVEPLMARLASAADRLEKRRFFRKLTVAHELRSLRQFFHEDRVPPDLDFETFEKFMMEFVDFRRQHGDNEARRRLIEQSSYRSLLLASMHFQDVYNYQLDRVQRCVIHYAAPDGRIYPFCTYNGGPFHRGRVEKRFGVPLARYRQARKNRPTSTAAPCSP